MVKKKDGKENDRKMTAAASPTPILIKATGVGDRGFRREKLPGMLL